MLMCLLGRLLIICARLWLLLLWWNPPTTVWCSEQELNVSCEPRSRSASSTLSYCEGCRSRLILCWRVLIGRAGGLSLPPDSLPPNTSSLASMLPYFIVLDRLAVCTRLLLLVISVLVVVVVTKSPLSPLACVMTVSIF